MTSVAHGTVGAVQDHHQYARLAGQLISGRDTTT